MVLNVVEGIELGLCRLPSVDCFMESVVMYVL
jgi:hypothetical protein